MKSHMSPILSAVVLLLSAAAVNADVEKAAPEKGLPTEIPADFVADTPLFDYTREEVMVPMRDGVELFTVIWRPKHSTEPMPIVLTRTPYDAANRPAWTHRPNSPKAAAAVPIPDAPLLRSG